MSWECPNCTAQNESGIVCEQCGYRRVCGIRITSAAGKSFETRINFNVDRKVYKEIDSEYQYLSMTPGSFQFQLLKVEDSPTGWGLLTSPHSDLNTLLNEGICQVGQVYPVYSGDVIRLGSRRNAGVTAAPLVISFEGE
ncbi:MAG: hypothetical protein J6X55_16130 [Victivallales bacterium]|nr:hypothetical protein [Victivallales bacterium]